MNGFELMDPKMDYKTDLESCFSPQKAKEAGTIKESWTNQEILAILNKFLIQEARWLKGNSALSSIYSFQLLADRSMYEGNEVLNAFLKYLLFFEYELVEIVRTTGCVREDEFTFPPTHEKKFTVDTFIELNQLLESTIESVRSQGQDDNVLNAISDHLEFRRCILHSVMMIAYGAE